MDIKPQPRYPFTFVQGDALEYVREHGREFDAIHASPPCQGYSIMRNLPWNSGREYPLLIHSTAEALGDAKRPWVIENVMGAKLASGWLCGTMFGLPFYRHRFFWTDGWFWLQPPHGVHRERIRGGHTLAGRAREMAFNGQRARDALGVTWMHGEREISSAIPPAYTEFIGRQLLGAVSVYGVSREGGEDVTPEERARKLMRELDDAMKSPRGDYYQGDIADPHRSRHIAERHIAAAIAEEREACAKVIPTTWLDPLLSGERAVFKGGPWDCPDIERLLDAIAAAIRART